MNDIVEFLTARLDEDQALAELQAPWPWHVGDEPTEVFAEDDIEVATAFALSSNQQRNTATFIARHDPARVLREVAAKRRTLVRHSPILTCGSMACDGCGWDREDGHHVEDIEECPELRDMASVYVEHADYDPAWSVTT